MNTDVRNNSIYSIDHIARNTGIDEEILRKTFSGLGVNTDNKTVPSTALRMLYNIIGSIEETDEPAQDVISDEEKNRRSVEILENIVKESICICIDTCGLRSWYIDRFVKNITPLLEREGKKITVPLRVKEELFTQLTSHKGEETDEFREVRKACDTLIYLNAHGLLEFEDIRKNLDHSHISEQRADYDIYLLAVQKYTSGTVTVITYDNDLSDILLELNSQNAYKTYPVNVMLINRFGRLSRHKAPESRVQPDSSQSRGKGAAKKSPYIFQTGAPEGDFSSSSANPHTIPKLGETVFGGSGTIYRLTEEIGSGGEGKVYRLNDGSAAKIYRSGKNSPGRIAKLRLMSSHRLEYPGLCWPLEVLCSQSGEPVGYRMATASGISLKNLIFNREERESRFPGIKKHDMVRLCISILETTDFLHRSGILIGDINLQNILVESPEKVWFVDCDSYQANRYGCPVGIVNFTPPELQGTDFRKRLRTIENERFSISVLLFTIMLMGKSPYSQSSSDDMGQAIREMDFLYPFGDNGKKNTPPGAGRFMWSQLPYSLKRYFYNTFQEGGIYSTEQTRLSDADWLSEFKNYHSLLETGKLQKQDPNADEIFPSSWKRDSQKTVYEKRRCRECGSEFAVYADEADKILMKGYDLPTRCPGCRYVRRNYDISQH